MKAPDFNYCCPETVEEVCEILEAAGSEARILAGGQSLVPAMNLRMASAELLIDINRVQALKGINLSDDGKWVRVGALVRHAEVASSPLIASQVPLVHKAMRYVAHPAVRNRGTSCGSLALADPSAEMPACAMTLNAMLVLQSKKDGVRHVRARDFFFGLYDTALREDEILTEVLWPCSNDASYTGFDELSRRHGDFALVGVAAQCQLEGAHIAQLNVVSFGTGPVPRLSEQALQIAAGQLPTEKLARQLAAQIALEIDPEDVIDIDIKRRQAGAIARRVLSQVFQECAHAS